MPAYQPGKGISHEALERLRSRKQVREGVLDLPDQDESKQWDQLLGEGAQKKPRCCVCTRPFTDMEKIPEQLICHNCLVVPEKAVPRGIRNQKAHTIPVCVTPSTEAASDDEDCGVEDLPKREFIVKARTPTCQEVMLEAVKKSLHGDWVGYGGGNYWIDCRRQKRWACIAEESLETYALIYDSEHGVVWWGCDRTHFLKTADLCARPDHINWYDARDMWSHDPDFVFYRRQEAWAASHNNRQNEAAIGEQRKCKESGAQLPEETSGGERVRTSREKLQVLAPRDVPCEDSYAAKAIFEIEQQLFAPGSKGFVWVDKWNVRFLKHLGTFRAFLESRPDRFVVIPGTGKGFRVAAVQRTQPQFR